MNNTRNGRHVLRGDLFGIQPMGLVCAALFMSWIVLILRIASIW